MKQTGGAVKGEEEAEGEPTDDNECKFILL